MSTMGGLILIFGISIGVATFLENDFGTLSAKAVVYNAAWFEALMGLLIVNMIVVVFSHRLYRKEKLVSFIFHVSFILILLGAAITRFVGFEGMMHIREGDASNLFVSDKTYISVLVTGENGHVEDDTEVMFTTLGGADYDKNFETTDGQVNVRLTEFIPNASYTLVDDPQQGAPVLTVVTTSNGGRVDKHLRAGQAEVLGGLSFVLNDTSDMSQLQIISSDSGLIMHSPVPVRFLKMADQSMGELAENQWHPFKERQLYIAGGASFVFKEYRPHARLALVSAEDKNAGGADAVKFVVSKGDVEQEITVIGGKGMNQTETTLQIGNTNISVGYGSVMLQLPFYIRLTDFQLERYPGSQSPSSYASEVVLLDESQGIEKPFRIYMNNILEHRGFRFYQSSYDQDELGTVLSVNHDYWGTFVTYWGYFFLFAGLIAVFFSKQTRFASLSKLVDQVHKKRARLTTIIVFLLSSTIALAHEGEIPVPDKAHAEKFSSIIYQSPGGRFMPVNTISNELLRKVVKKDSWQGLNSDQVFLSMVSHPTVWREVKMVLIKEEAVQRLVGADGKYASFLDFFTPDGQYKLKEAVDVSFARKPSERTTFDKEIIAVDERVNICYMTYFGSFMKIFPIPGHPDYKWTSPMERFENISRKDSLFISNTMLEYFDALEAGMSAGDYSKADEIVTSIKAFQREYGGEVLPSERKVKMEIMYNKYNIFKRLYPFNMLAGFAFLIILYIRILNPKRELQLAIKILKWLITAGFAVHSLGLIARWYISGHEPWSNGYESMIYIAWTGLLAGLIFQKKSPMTLAVTAILSGIILWVAHMSWMDPEITNLVPVLKSYWLAIHVATIVASYGFLALGALLAFINLVSMILRN
ncbi:MAG: cytochrome c biogenesis protein ResB, partial [Cyclobacteriaceae bacterium]|nr:cytochrome c biogenesis protein ResB [Cyclobacteriaceae bacterium]